MPDPCPCVDKKRIRCTAFSLYGYAQHKNPCPEGYEIYNFIRLFLGHHYLLLILSEPWQGVERRFFLDF